MRTQSVLCGLALAMLCLCASPASARNVDTYTAKSLYSFCPTQQPCSDGAFPFAGLVRDSLGNFYGVTAGGGGRDYGTVFELSPTGKTGGKWRYRRLYSFCPFDCSDGKTPIQTLIIDTAGNLYGTTSEGGHAGNGVVFELSRNGRKWKEHVLHYFCSQENCTDGGGSYDRPSGLTYAGAASGAPYDGVSPLFGANVFGGKFAVGVIYQLSRTGKNRWRHDVVYNFCKAKNCKDGAYPLSPVMDSAGNIFGMTQAGGRDGLSYEGVVFELSLVSGTWKEQVLHAFCSAENCADGKGPWGGIAIDSAGNVYGTTAAGGTATWLDQTGYGVIFKLSHDGNGWHESILHEFCSFTDCDDGWGAEGKPVLDSAGNLFGATESHGSDFGEDDGGTVYRLQGSDYQVIYTFCTQNSCAESENNANADLYVDSTGNVFGTASNDGDYGWGYVFELTP